MTPAAPARPDPLRGRRPAPAAVAALTAYTAVAVAHLGAQLTEPQGFADVTQAMAAPLLLLALVAATRVRELLTRWTAAGLAASWAGDTVPHFVPESLSFIVLMGCFLVAQACFVVAFWPTRRESLLPTRWVWVYAAVALVMVVVCAPKAGPLTVGVAIYGATLSLMALLSAGVHVLAGMGGVLFLVSDGLIALGEFVPSLTLPQSGFWVMATYLVALGLLTVGVLTRTMSGEVDSRA